MPTALIVEDEPEANRLLGMLVQLKGYRAQSAYTGAEALAIARRELPDIIFLDLMLPDVSGHEVCKTLKADPDTGQIPVVMVTARLAAENRLEGLRMGAEDYIAKPYLPDQIFRAMAEVASSRGELDPADATGQILLDPAEASTWKSLSRLLSLVRAGTRLDPQSIDAARTLFDAAIDGAPSVHRPPTLSYYFDAATLTLTLKTAPTWAATLRHFEPEKLPRMTSSNSTFDTLTIDAEAGLITLKCERRT